MSLNQWHTMSCFVKVVGENEKSEFQKGNSIFLLFFFLFLLFFRVLAREESPVLNIVLQKSKTAFFVNALKRGVGVLEVRGHIPWRVRHIGFEGNVYVSVLCTGPDCIDWSSNKICFLWNSFFLAFSLMRGFTCWQAGVGLGLDNEMKQIWSHCTSENISIRSEIKKMLGSNLIEERSSGTHRRSLSPEGEINKHLLRMLKKHVST